MHWCIFFFKWRTLKLNRIWNSCNVLEICEPQDVHLSVYGLWLCTSAVFFFHTVLSRSIAFQRLKLYGSDCSTIAVLFRDKVHCETSSSLFPPCMIPTFLFIQCAAKQSWRSEHKQSFQWALTGEQWHVLHIIIYKNDKKCVSTLLSSYYQPIY